MNITELVTRLSSAAGIGHLNEAAQIATKYLEPFSRVTQNQNCLLAEIGEGDYTVLLEAHMDEVGMIVTEIFDDGFISVSPVGSIDPRHLPSQPVTIYGKETVKGCFTSIPPHLKADSAIPSFENCKIDTGDLDIKNKVSLGDLVLFDAPATPLLGSRITGKALDNRAGMAAVIAAGEKIAKANSKIKVILLFPLGEELGLRGARVSSYNINANECIAVDVSFGDCPDVPPHKTAKLGSGAMIGVSPVLDRSIYKELEQTARENCIPYTLEVMGGTTSTDADVISLNKSGIKTGLVSIPLRNMHTPCEVADVNDILEVANLIAAYVERGGLSE